jgi:hypothetical protein
MISFFSGEYCDRLNTGSECHENVSIPPNLLPSSSALFHAAASATATTAITTPSQLLAGPSSERPPQAVEKRRAVSVKRGASVPRNKSQPPSAPSTTLRPDVWIGYFDLRHWDEADFKYLKGLKPGSDEAIKAFQHLADHEEPPQGWTDEGIDAVLILYDLVQYYWCTGLGESS